jgi:predicted TIM-barrel fold metal-dependent hydrolase
MSAELPASVKPYAGRITDVDSHEQIPAQAWVETFGEAMRPFAEVKLSQPATNANHPNVRDYAGDVMEITDDNVWVNKGCTAPGAFDVRRRLEVMDRMQVRRQLMFPTAAGIYGMLTYTAPKGSAQYKVFGDRSEEMGRQMLAAGNAWLLAAGKVSDRIRPVANLYGETVEELTLVARSLIKDGARALMISASRPPGGVSPADDTLDPFYAMLAEAKVALTVHVGGEGMFTHSDVWNKAQVFSGFKVNEEMSGDPLRLSTFHLAAQNFVSTLVLGGVFDRHPQLRFGIVEYGAHFIGPLAALMDMWAASVFKPNETAASLMKGQKPYHLPLKPSEYIRRNVRVSPFDFEPVGDYIEKYGLHEVYCFASDYPHIEGGKDPIRRLAENLAAHGHGASTFEKFFVTNGEWLLPD